MTSTISQGARFFFSSFWWSGRRCHRYLHHATDNMTTKLMVIYVSPLCTAFICHSVLFLVGEIFWLIGSIIINNMQYKLSMIYSLDARTLPDWMQSFSCILCSGLVAFGCHALFCEFMFPEIIQSFKCPWPNKAEMLEFTKTRNFVISAVVSTIVLHTLK